MRGGENVIIGAKGAGNMGIYEQLRSKLNGSCGEELSRWHTPVWRARYQHFGFCSQAKHGLHSGLERLHGI